jgi:hypothetical protein
MYPFANHQFYDCMALNVNVQMKLWCQRETTKDVYPGLQYETQKSKVASASVQVPDAKEAVHPGATIKAKQALTNHVFW